MILKLKLENEQERERIRKFYDTISFGRSRTGRIVRAAMGTSSTAGKIIEELSVDEDRN